MHPTYQLPGISFLLVLILYLILVDFYIPFFMEARQTIFSLMKHGAKVRVGVR